MNRGQLEHLLRAGGSVADETELVVVGSQAILASLPDPPPELAASMEADIYPLHAPEKADLIDGSIGELSPFHHTFGYYAHGIAPATATLPSDWRSRAVAISGSGTCGVVGWCPAPADLAVSKLAAGRAKDMDYVRALMVHGIVDVLAVERLLDELPLETATLVRERLTMATRMAR